ncbi:GPI ethanolamine phosphate transferase 2 [Aphelenchoides bicaudatus]|nr:GPI ethanolamine phosphate transferase 2 [Aphelenchoides bicaudatus]
MYVCLQIVGTLLFMFGFFPQRIVIEQSEVNVEKAKLRQEKNNRLIFMIIDAFSYEFISNADYKDDMPYLQKSIENGDPVLFRARVQSPTVTLPRIKALVSGVIPNYMDVVFNLAQTRFSEDNWIMSAKDAGNKILFYGDDTWFSMFTEEPFLSRSEGTSSFFVKDYAEVDTNVTRHLNGEFSKKSSWDIMILHYLGLDHIGHSLGGKSPKVHDKLKEMDSVIHGIWKNFTASRSNDEDIWFFVLGDHGMTLAGGHGGSSERESYVPLIVWSSSTTNRQKTEVVNVQQVDLVPTISLLLNLGIPEKSVGVLLDEYFSTDQEKLAKKIELNAAQFYLLAKANKGLFSEEEFGSLNECRDIKQTGLSSREFVSKCRLVLKDVQRRFLSSNDNLNYTFVIAGTVTSLIATAALLFNSLKNQSLSVGLLVLVQPLSLFSSSFIEEEHDLWYYLFPTCVFVTVIRECWIRKTKQLNCAKLKDLLILLFAHRISRFPYEINRRRWTLEDEFGVLNWSKDLNESLYLWCLAATALLACSSPFKLVMPKRSLSGLFVLISWVFIFAVKFSFIRAHLIVHLVILSVFLIGGFSNGFIAWQLLVLNPVNYLIALLCQLIGYKLAELNKTVGFNHSAILHAALSATFFYTGGGNSLDTIDIATGYAGLSDFVPAIVGTQMTLNAYLGTLNLMIGWNFAQKLVHLPTKRIIVDVFALRSLALFFTILNLFHQRSHLFNWSVFTPKLLIEGLHFLSVCLWALFSYAIYLYNLLVSKSFNNLL